MTDPVIEEIKEVITKREMGNLSDEDLAHLNEVYSKKAKTSSKERRKLTRPGKPQVKKQDLDDVIEQKIQKLRQQKEEQKSKSVRFCPECGAKRQNDAKFCAQCGARFTKGGPD